ncbi:HTH_48 domain-containing protein [Trichonephila clavata]|uniref:HTH_48 domain-containing protein n=1 Tax=Trichonephila clavata TaxID=2740835 RepID=A0A8X6GT68_TRICU|nr:HTH_48 domain-containing protein [Trichonephila clavata]
MDVSKWRTYRELDGRARPLQMQMSGKVDGMIRANRRITIDEVAEELGISRASSKHHPRYSSIQKSVSTMGAPTIDLDTPGTTHGGQPGTSCALP